MSDLDAIMMHVTGGCTATRALLEALPADVLGTIGALADQCDSRQPGAEHRSVEHDLGYGRLTAREDSLPGITVHLEMAQDVSFQMGDLWLTDTLLPDTLVNVLVGRRLREIVEMPDGIPGILADSRVRRVRDAGSRRKGNEQHHLRLVTDLPRWLPRDWGA